MKKILIFEIYYFYENIINILNLFKKTVTNIERKCKLLSYIYKLKSLFMNKKNIQHKYFTINIFILLYYIKTRQILILKCHFITDIYK